MRKPHLSHHIPERFLRQLWKHQQFQTQQFTTSDGQPIEIISPGTLNRNGGPDFTGARIRIGSAVFCGDVELHQWDSQWNDHHHDNDPKYNSVILHVVLHARASSVPPSTASKRTVPLLILERFLRAPFHAIWNTMILNERSERTRAIKCYNSNNSVDAAVIRQWLQKLAIERIELKVRRFEERLKELIDHRYLVIKEPPPKYDEIPFGINPDELPPVHTYTQQDFAPALIWEQLLYEGIMESLGYAKNREPFLHMARNLTLRQINQVLAACRRDGEKCIVLESLLFHVGGLLPLLKDVADQKSKAHIRRLRKQWRHLKMVYRGDFLSPADWQFFRLRPENFPTVRLAGAARLIVRFNEQAFLTSIIHIVKDTTLTNKQKFDALEELFITPADEYWSRHYHFEGQGHHDMSTLIGRSRADDMILNTVIPICLLYARIFKDREVRQGSLILYEQSPPLSDNAVTRTIDRELIKRKFALGSAMLQQGAMQLHTSFCMLERCSDCAVGKIVFARCR